MNLKYEAIELPKKAKKPAERKETGKKAKKQVANDAVKAETKSFSLEEIKAECRTTKLKLNDDIWRAKQDIKQLRLLKRQARTTYKLKKTQAKISDLIEK